MAASPDPHKATKEMKARHAEVVRNSRAASGESKSPSRDRDLRVTQPSLLDVRRLIKSATEAELQAVRDLLLKLRAIAHQRTT